MFTSTRADAWPLGPVFSILDEEPSVELVVLATGAHLDEVRGNTLNELRLGPATTITVIPSDVSHDGPSHLASALAEITEGVSKAIERHRLDALVVLGDRWELLGAVGAAVLHGVAIVHLHGGEVTEGALDERIRHAITKAADLHLCATETYATRIRQLGEEPWRIHVTGAPSLDALTALPTPTPDAFERAAGLTLRRPWGIVTYHPTTVERDRCHERATAVFEAAANALADCVLTYPGADPGAEEVVRALRDSAEEHDNLHVVPSLGPNYALALACADVMVGNSSSGIIEAATFRLPVVDVGDRQLGRVKPANVIPAKEEAASITAAIEQAVAPTFRAKLSDLVNPYGDGGAAGRIRDAILTDRYLTDRRKRFIDAP